MDELGPEAVAAVRTAAQAAAEWPSRERLDALAHALDKLAARDMQWRAMYAIVAKLATLSAGPGMPAFASLIDAARVLVRAIGK